MAQRERIDTGNDTRYARRDARGRFTSSDDAGRASAADQRTPMAGPTRKGQGDRGDRPRKPSSGR